MEIKPYLRRPQFYETDGMSIIWHGNYVRWMEEARTDFMDQLGFPYARAVEAGIDFALTARRARMSNHRQFRHDHRGIFNKVRIGIFRRGRKHGDLQAELQKGLYIGEKLARGGSDIRRAQLGGSLSCAAGGGR